jgi:7tm Chemosensory receptor
MACLPTNCQYWFDFSTLFLAFETIGSLQDEILMSPMEENCCEEDESLLQQKQHALTSILSRAKPLMGEGFFNADKPMIMSVMGAAITYIIVLLQFNMSEKPTSSGG